MYRPGLASGARQIQAGRGWPARWALVPLIVLALVLTSVQPVLGQLEGEATRQDAVEYEVRRGDTLFSLAQRFGTTVAAIVERNDIEDPNLIFVGQTLVIPPPEDPDMAVCLRGDNFVADGHIETFERDPGDARMVLGFRLGVHEGCERLVVDLGAGEEMPAETVGRVEAELLRDLGVVRIHLGEEFELFELTGTETDVDLDGALIDRAYLVRSLDDVDGGVYVDVHLAEPALTRVLVLDSPARIVVDARPGGDELPEAAAVANNVVVLQPRSEEPPATASYPLTITGYARTFEANVIAIVRSNDEIDVEDFTTAASWVETWGEFELTLEEGPLGEIELFVGERSAKDGTEQGVRINLVME